ncbi:MAG: DUF1566 domain-containing protein [Deltaproteobacteria bacterium]|nr:DUF1566 domain-containing protein [Deltaproteobacteria bacterium]
MNGECVYQCYEDYEDNGKECISTVYWYDNTTGLFWQKFPNGQNSTWTSARDHCYDLFLGGYTDWRIPTISELRSLVRGCTATHINGLCDISDDCPYSSCDSTDCLGCSDSEGPADGCYWPSDLGGFCNAAYWSATNYNTGTGYAWVLGFDQARFAERDKSTGADVRCVRGP